MKGMLLFLNPSFDNLLTTNCEIGLRKGKGCLPNLVTMSIEKSLKVLRKANLLHGQMLPMGNKKL